MTKLISIEGHFVTKDIRAAWAATLPIAAPEEAATELERGVTRLGLVGSMLCGRTREKNLDHPDFVPMLETAARLGVPLLSIRRYHNAP